MSDGVLLLLALAAATLGMAGLAFSIGAHWRQLFDRRRQSFGVRMALRTTGFVLIAGSFVICAVADPFMMAILVWPMLLLVGATLVAAGLTIHARAQTTKARAEAARRRLQVPH